MIHLEDWKLYLICIKQKRLTVHFLLSVVPLQMQQISHMNPVATSVCTVKVTRCTKSLFIYEVYSESKDTKFLNVYNIFNLQKRHYEWIACT